VRFDTILFCFVFCLVFCFFFHLFWKILLFPIFSFTLLYVYLADVLIHLINWIRFQFFLFQFIYPSSLQTDPTYPLMPFQPLYFNHLSKIVPMVISFCFCISVLVINTWIFCSAFFILDLAISTPFSPFRWLDKRYRGVHNDQNTNWLLIPPELLEVLI